MGDAAASVDLDELWRVGAATWSQLQIERSRFAAVVGPVVANTRAPVDAGELYLAVAWSEGVPTAARAFDDAYVPALRRRLGRMGLSDADIDDIAQRVRERLLQRDADGPAVLLRYAGRGRLRSLVGVVGARIAIDLHRERNRETSDTDVLAELATLSDPRSELMRRESRALFKSAFEAAIATLSPRERTTLRMHLVDGLKLEEIADLYRVHRVTVSRWLIGAREKLLEQTRSIGRARYSLGDSELDAIFAVTKLSMSLNRLLGG